MGLSITPETRLGVLLDTYPGLEDVLIARVPAFSKLKNPILRKTVAKVATLDQAAKIGGIGVRELVHVLREATGQANLETVTTSTDPATQRAVQIPSWLHHDQIRHDLDADRLLEAGEHPIGRVCQCLSTLEAGQIVRLSSSFLPAPLIDSLKKNGLLAYTTEAAPGRHVTYITRKPPSS